MKRLINTFLVIVALVASAAAQQAIAQAYPTKPVTVVVSFPPGGDTDAIARLLGDKLSQELKQPFIIENRPGAGGSLGDGFVSRARADGYTLLFTPNSLPIVPFVVTLSGANSYHPINAFEPIIKTATQPLILVAHPSTGFKNVADLIQAAKSGKVSYASSGQGSPMQLVGEMLNRAANVKMTHVPYRGVGPAVVDVVAGHVQTAWVTIGAVSQYIEQKKLIPLAIADAKRSPLAPTVPTLVESGYPSVIVTAWNGFFAPKGTPDHVIQLINRHVGALIQQPDVVARFASSGALPAGGTPAELAKTVQSDYSVLGTAIKELGIKAD